MSSDKQAKQHMIDVRNEVVRQGRWATCTNCECWTDRTEFSESGDMKVYNYCAKYKMIPPPEVIVVGCANHESGVPF